MKKIKVGITGVAGMLGSHLAELLIEDGHTLVGVDDLSYGSILNLENVIDHNNFKFLSFDVRVNNLIQAAFIDCEILIHLAAVKKVIETQSSFETLDVNVSFLDQYLYGQNDRSFPLSLEGTFFQQSYYLRK